MDTARGPRMGTIYYLGSYGLNHLFGGRALSGMLVVTGGTGGIIAWLFYYTTLIEVKT